MYTVTETSDDATNPADGSLRFGLMNAPAAGRIIVFDCAGLINLQAHLVIPSNVTIAGETAPDPGTTIAGPHQVQTFLYVHPVTIPSNNVIIRHVRIRADTTANPRRDALSVYRSDRVMIDHCSISWGSDGCVCLIDSTNVTMQWCIISEGLLSTDPDVRHSTGTLITNNLSSRASATVHHNLYAHHRFRSVQAYGKQDLDFVNNVVYNWERSFENSPFVPENRPERGFATWLGITTGETIHSNVVNNYYRMGPDSVPANGQERSYAFVTQLKSKTYLTGNYLDKAAAGGGLFWVTEENVAATDPGFGGSNPQGFFLDPPGTLEGSRFSFPGVFTDSPSTAYTRVILEAGANLTRDVELSATDERIINEVQALGGSLVMVPPEDP